jgi:hypothetical protein
MYQIYIAIHCPTRWTEVLPEKLEEVEVTVEALVSQALLELFSMVIVEQVMIVPNTTVPLSE